jgi:peptidoglycan/LPS O-acetylase OafA/YrhL
MTPSTTSRAIRHLPGLDGLRGALVLGILAYHLGHAPGMFVTVDGFFALSGFLITGLLLHRTPTDASQLRQWWLRRMRRLAPAVTVVVAVVVVVFAATDGIARDAFATLTWWANWNQILEGMPYWSPEPSPLRHAWTLSIEEQFYVVWPLLLTATVLLARRIGRRPAAAVAAVAGVLGVSSFVWAAWLTQHGADLNRIYLGTDTRVGSVLLGCCAAAVLGPASFVHEPRPAGAAATTVGFVALGVAVGLGLVLVIDEPITYTGGLALGTLAWVAVVVVVARPGPLASLFSLRPLQWLGVRSYGIYLWSWPVQVLVERTWPDAARPVVSVVTVAASLVLGAWSLRLVESPLRAGTGWASSPRIRRAAWSGGAVATLVAIAVVAATAVPPPAYRTVTVDESAAAALESARAAADAATTSTADPSTTASETTTAPGGAPGGAPGATAPDPGPSTAAPGAAPADAASTGGPAPRPLRVVSAGDSQAFNAAHPPVPREELPPYIESVTLAGVLGCGILVRAPGWTLYDPERGGLVSGAYCRETAEVAEVEALRARPDWMVLFSGGFERPHDYRAPDGRMLPARHPDIRAAVVEHLTARVERARAAGTRTALVEWACPGIEVGDAVLAEATRWHNTILREVAASVPGTITIPPSEAVCIDGDATGRPTPDKERAWGFEVHPVDRGWLWGVQIGPALLAAS